MTPIAWCSRARERPSGYYRDKTGWLKVSARGRVFRMTAEQVLNHLLLALAFGDSLSLTVRVEHFEGAYWETLVQNENRAESVLAETDAATGAD